MRAVDAVMECLKAEGVDVVFGLPGGANLPTYDAFVDAGIKHVLVRHEAGGGHAAEGYAKATGKVGVSLGTSGPGATNLVTPIVDAMMDSVPVVFITGQVRTDLLGTDGFQEADTMGITMPAVKHSFMVQHPLEIPRAIHEAFYIARTGRPGPVVVDIPTDLSRADIPYEPVTDVHLPGYQPTTEGNTKQIRQAAKALAAARRPVIYAGGGVINANAAAELTEFCRADRFPVTCTLMGLGGFPAPDPQWLGMLGMHGTRAANYAMDEADLICAVGARFDDRITGKLSEFAPRAKFIHIDVDPAEISKNIPAHIPIVGDAKNILAKLLVEYRALGADASRLEEWWQRIEGWREKHPLRYDDSTDAEIKPQRMIEALYEATGGDAIVTSDVGQHQMWAAQYFHFAKPRRWISSGGLGTMGFGLPAAMGAQVGCPDKTVVCITGDGSVQMNMQELATCAQENIPIKIFISNNGYLGMVRQWQELFWDRRYSHVDMGQFPDFVKLAEAYGATGLRFEDKSTLVSDMKQALATPGPVLVDVRVTREENTYPMIAPGQAARDMVGCPSWASQARRSCCRSRSSRRPAGCTPAASTCCRSSSRTSPASSRGSRASSRGAASTSTR
jgi:acetolactate synthase-1/2/3 large subunit